MKRCALIFSLILNFNLWASSREYVDTLGTSPKGQYVAFETYGFRPEEKKFFSTIKILNVWKKEYVGSPINVEILAITPNLLPKARAKARNLALDELKKFKISG